VAVEEFEFAFGRALVGLGELDQGFEEQRLVAPRVR